MSPFGRRVPDIDIDLHLAQDDAALRAAFDAARSGDRSPARDLLASVRHDYDRRARYVWVLAESTTEQTWAQMSPGRRRDAGGHRRRLDRPVGRRGAGQRRRPGAARPVADHAGLGGARQRMETVPWAWWGDHETSEQSFLRARKSSLRT